MAEWGKPASIEVFAPSAAHEPALRAWWARLLRQAATPVSIGEVLRALAETDVRALLPRVRAQALVLHRRGDLAVRFGAGEHLARNLPRATFVPLEGDDHFWWLGEQDALFDAIRRHAAGSSIKVSASAITAEASTATKAKSYEPVTSWIAAPA